MDKGAWAAAPGLEEEEEELTWPCCPELCLGGTREECWEDRPVGLLGGTDRSECWWWSPGWNASPGHGGERGGRWMRGGPTSEHAFPDIREKLGLDVIKKREQQIYCKLFCDKQAKELNKYTRTDDRSVKSFKEGIRLCFLPGGVGRRHMVLKCLGVVLQWSAEVDRGFPREEPLEFWDG